MGNTAMQQLWKHHDFGATFAVFILFSTLGAIVFIRSGKEPVNAGREFVRYVALVLLFALVVWGVSTVCGHFWPGIKESPAA